MKFAPKKSLGMVWICMVQLLTQNIHTWNKCHAYPYIYGNLWYYKSAVFTTNNDPPKLPRNFPKKIDWPLRNGGPITKKSIFFPRGMAPASLLIYDTWQSGRRKQPADRRSFLWKIPSIVLMVQRSSEKTHLLFFMKSYQLVCRISSINGIA